MHNSAISYRQSESYRMQNMQQGKLVDAYAEAVQSAAENKSGSMNGFMGIGMMNMATNEMVVGAASGPCQNTQNSQMDLSKQNVENTPKTSNEPLTEGKEEWQCECGVKNDGNFCANWESQDQYKIIIKNNVQTVKL